MLAINLSNLHVGGGVQVATSFILELSKFEYLSSKISVFASTEVDKQLRCVNCTTSPFNHYEVFNVYGMGFGSYLLKNKLKKFKVVLTLFGPLYLIKKSFVSIVGFAQPWIIYPDNECYCIIPLCKRIFTRMKYQIQSFFFLRSDFFVVELNHVKEGLIRELNVDSQKISVVKNTISSIYFDSTTWQPLSIPNVECDIRLGFVGRNYLHKNTNCFVEIARIFHRDYGKSIKFFVTFTDEEWKNCTTDFKSVSINVGALTVSQCPTFYNNVDGVIFPSLLECFSSAPLEAMAMEKILFASDRQFNRDVCQDHARYFDPLSAESAAKAIANVFINGDVDELSLVAARDYVVSLSRADVRAQKYVELMIQHYD